MTKPNQNQNQGPRGRAGHVTAEASLGLKSKRGEKRKRDEKDVGAGEPPAKKHARSKPNVRKRRCVRRTRTVKREEKWERKRDYRRMQRRLAALSIEGEPAEYELGEGEVEGAGFSDEESGVETEEEYLEEVDEMDGVDVDEEEDDEMNGSGAGAVAQQVMA